MALRPLTSRAQRRRFSVYDLEWIPGHRRRAAQHGFQPFQLRVVGTFDGKRYRHYGSIQSWLNSEFTTRNNGRWFFAHAGGLADINFVLRYLIEADRPGIHIEAAFSGSSAIIVRVRRGKYSWYLCDSFWLIRQSLKKIGKWLGQEKGSDHAEGIDIFYLPQAELIDYNRRDCEILWHAISYFENVVLGLGGQLEKTIASTAMSLFRRRYLKETILPVPLINSADIGRNAYIASRVEVYQREVRNAEYYDINSSFPFAMTQPQPGNLLGSQRELPRDPDSLYLARCTIEVPGSIKIPPLPIRNEEDGRVYFPVGSWTQWFDRSDLELLEETGGRIISVHDVLTFEPFDDMAEYAFEIYEMRRSSTDPAEKVVLKFLLNSLYGKFAESPLKEKVFINPRADFFDKPEAMPGGTGRSFLMPGVWKLLEETRIAHEHVPIAVHITSLARANITRHMLRAGEVYYVDTDGFACPPGAPVETSDELGALKLEKHIHEATFAAPKLYAYREAADQPWNIKAKGFSKVKGRPAPELPADYDLLTPMGRWSVDEDEDQRPLSYEDFCHLLDHQDVMIEQFARVRSGLKVGQVGPRETLQPKTWRNTSRPKRKPQPGGKSRPWWVHELRQKWVQGQL